ncbi:hypothetical protein HK405_006981 [Cladochytrium tenue]|nr:hypothetical protein HK405_006981 [Cladochytrium tenue]
MVSGDDDGGDGDDAPTSLATSQLNLSFDGMEGALGGAVPARSAGSGNHWLGGRCDDDDYDDEKCGSRGNGGVKYSGLFSANRHRQSDVSTVAGLKRVEDAYADLLEEPAELAEEERLDANLRAAAGGRVQPAQRRAT